MLMMTGCAPKKDVLTLPEKLNVPHQKDTSNASLLDDAPMEKTKEKPFSTEMMPAPPKPGVKTEPVVSTPAPASDATQDVSLNFEHIPLPALIQLVFTDIIKRPLQIDPEIMARRDVVTFRTPPKQTPAQVLSATLLLLKSYGIAAVDVGGLVRVVPEKSQLGYLPEIRRGASLPETPDALRPVFQLIDLEAVRNTDVTGWVRNLFSAVTIMEDPTRNAVLLSGQPNAVTAAIEAIKVLDQPVMRGRPSLNITPAYLSAESLAIQLAQILAAEGYSVPQGVQATLSGGIRYPILVLPLAATNSVLVFAHNKDVLAHIQQWAVKLDRPSDSVKTNRFFAYTVRNTSAEEVAKTLRQFFSGATSSASSSKNAFAKASPTTGEATAANTASAQTEQPADSQVIVDTPTNTLIIRVEPDQMEQLHSLLRMLDKATKSALLEVTVAEITLTDKSALGVEWLLEKASLGGGGVTAKTLGGLGIASSGLTITNLTSAGDTRLVINALASSNKASILSSPRVMVRNGEEASIQVGQEVPIITSQQSSLEATTNDNTQVLQTVEYRNTGIILNVKPVIHSGDRIDLELTQEVSAAQETKTGVTTSPTIATRKVQTKLTLQNGSTILLGGLISKDVSGGNTGIPFLKDLPVLGKLFSTESSTDVKTELIVLITPYIIGNDAEATAITKEFQKAMPWLEESTNGTLIAPGGITSPVSIDGVPLLDQPRIKQE